MTTQRTHLRDYRTPHFSVESVKLSFQIFAEHTIVTSEMQMQVLQYEPIYFDGHDFELLSWKINGQEPRTEDFQFHKEGLEIKSSGLSLGSLQLEFTTKLLPNQNKSLEGLYASGGSLVTQCESQGFRRITFYPDRPDVMTFFTVQIEADKNRFPILLSNGDRTATEDAGEGRHRVTWQDPFKKPSYLFALVACDLGVLKDTFTTQSGKTVNLEIYCSKGNETKCTFAMKALQKAMAWDEKKYGLEYDLKTYMIVAIEDFNAGAMENKGLNIFNAKYILADRKSATDVIFQSVDAIVAHEYFHNYTGNRVTLRDWFQLTLKEGLTVYRDQEFSADVYDRGVMRVYDIQRLMTEQFPEDDGPNSHPIRPDSYLSVDNFFTTTIYEKGAEVIRMLETILGKEAFATGLKHYLQKHDGQAVTAEDFVQALSESAGIPLQDFLPWYSESGTPRIQLKEDFDSKTGMMNVTFEQKRKSEKLPLMIPIKFKAYVDGDEMPCQNRDIHINSERERMFILKEKRKTFVVGPFPKKPVMTYLHSLSAPVRLHQNRNAEEWAQQARLEQDAFVKLEALQELCCQYWQTESDLDLKNLLSVLETVFKGDFSPYLKSLLLQLPDDASLIQKLKIDSFSRIDQIRQRLEKVIGHHFMPHFKKLAAIPVPDGLDVLAMGQRSLIARCQFYLAMAEDRETLLQLQAQMKNPTSMTEEMATLESLSQLTDSPLFEEALIAFQNRWSTNKLVMNQWLEIQARQRSQRLTEKVKALVEGPHFSIENPNNVYSLLRNYGKNWSSFYSQSIENFRFLLSQISRIDKFNPSVAARLIPCFQFVGQLPKTDRRAIESQFAEVLKSDLSKNSRELLEGTHKAVVASLALGT